MRAAALVAIANRFVRAFPALRALVLAPARPHAQLVWTTKTPMPPACRRSVMAQSNAIIYAVGGDVGSADGTSSRRMSSTSSAADA